ncbi:Cytosolic sulfotransferase 5 [Acorus gramineus]|uniref:Sulfotransferase n=1 Tax=Acorus gramineus TaxID=55184 RepID=A0AAV9BBT1_ACOGR|nr:Cytosolic sulfotransferase 5 [Acorus gramineus]KAK1274046.1 Cytosolic sulfotransferase 5 [Acorus gramineus]
MSSSNENYDKESTAQESYKRYKDLITTLPTQPWGPGGDDDDLHQYHGFWFHRLPLEGIMAARDHFVARPTDIFLVTFPKSGTTWLKALTFAMVNRNPHECVPFLSNLYLDGRLQDLDSLPAPRLFSAHVPYSLLPDSVLTSGCRIVYHSFDEFFELFCLGVSMGGPIWEHTLGYWRESLRRPERVMFMKYEQLKGDTRESLKRLGEFIGCPFSEEEEREGRVEEIVGMCSFERLSGLEVNKYGRFGSVKNQTFFRRGEVGDWKSHLIPEMAERLDRITEEKLRGSGLEF